MTTPLADTIHHRICPLCEACCGLEIKVRCVQIFSIRSHDADVFSAGYICPNGVALKDLHNDPDRLRMPLIKRTAGSTPPAGKRPMPGRTETAAMADAHHFIRPGADVYLLADGHGPHAVRMAAISAGL